MEKISCILVKDDTRTNVCYSPVFTNDNIKLGASCFLRFSWTLPGFGSWFWCFPKPAMEDTVYPSLWSDVALPKQQSCSWSCTCCETLCTSITPIQTWRCRVSFLNTYVLGVCYMLSLKLRNQNVETDLFHFTVLRWERTETQLDTRKAVL